MLIEIASICSRLGKMPWFQAGVAANLAKSEWWNGDLGVLLRPVRHPMVERQPSELAKPIYDRIAGNCSVANETISSNQDA